MFDLILARKPFNFVKCMTRKRKRGTCSVNKDVHMMTYLNFSEVMPPDPEYLPSR
jgi:hypothetical protein